MTFTTTWTALPPGSLWGVRKVGHLSPAHTTIWQKRVRVRSPKLVFLAGSNALQSVRSALLCFPGEVPGPRSWVLELVREGSTPLPAGGGRNKRGILPSPLLLHQRWGSWYQLRLTYTLMAGSHPYLEGHLYWFAQERHRAHSSECCSLKMVESGPHLLLVVRGKGRCLFFTSGQLCSFFLILTPFFSCLWEQG